MGTFDGPLVMQVVSVVNANQPSIRQESNDGHRLLLLKLTDGVNKVTAIEYKRIDALRYAESFFGGRPVAESRLEDVLTCCLTHVCSLDTPPGTKLVLKHVSIVKGKLLLTPSCVKVLGGEVPALVSSWAASRVGAWIRTPRTRTLSGLALASAG